MGEIALKCKNEQLQKCINLKKPKAYVDESAD